MKVFRSILLVFAILSTYSASAQIAITSDGSSGDPSAMLEIKSTSKGFLLPRMTEVERNAISSPATGLIVFCANCGDHGEAQIYNGTIWTNMVGDPASPGPIVAGEDDVTSLTGKIWMDRNLGATQVATSSTDADSYGDLYQWGRGTDGHQLRTSDETDVLSSTDSPDHGDFIKNPSTATSEDWRNPQNNDLWQGANGTNNPCPSGYRLPTKAEWEAEIDGWENAGDAFSSVLKLPMGGTRNRSDGSIASAGSFALYWSSTVEGTRSSGMYINSGNAELYPDYRATGNAVRCIKN